MVRPQVWVPDPEITPRLLMHIAAAQRPQYSVDNRREFSELERADLEGKCAEGDHEKSHVA